MVTNALRVQAARMARRPGRAPSRDDDSGNIMFALLLCILGLALAALMTPIVLTAINGTRTDQQRATSLASAEAGIQVIVGQIRAANDGTAADNGLLAMLPCGTQTSSVGVGGNGRYQTTVSYFPSGSNPRGQSSTWLAANAIQCIPGAGVRSAPGYALIVSTGTDQATGTIAVGDGTTRTLQATYVFHTNNANIAGGLLHVYKTSTSTDLCIDAGSGSPTVGTIVTMQPCSNTDTGQKFSYNQTLTLSLVSTTSASQPNGAMCLDAGTPEVANAVLKIAACGTSTLPQQEWSFNDSANFSGTSDGATLNNLCFNVQTPNFAGSQIILSTNCNGGYDNIQTWQPDASAGAGAAGASSGQLVNFNQFGRCLDVAGQDPNAQNIAWPCKQAPIATNVTWNQRWTLPTITGTNTSASGNIVTHDTANGTTYCLTSPGSVTATASVDLTTCPTGSSSSTNQTWTVYGKTTDTTSSYRIMDGYGYCLQPSDPTGANPDMYNSVNGISNIDVAVCSSSTLQKWNAPPSLFQSAITDVGEK